MQGKITKIKTTCPRCHGTGKARAFNRNQKYSEKLRERIKKLYDKGYSLRKIANKLALNHPQTVKNILSCK